jgi:hypothetical protein
MTTKSKLSITNKEIEIKDIEEQIQGEETEERL